MVSLNQPPQSLGEIAIRHLPFSDLVTVSQQSVLLPKQGRQFGLRIRSVLMDRFVNTKSHRPTLTAEVIKLSCDPNFIMALNFRECDDHFDDLLKILLDSEVFCQAYFAANCGVDFLVQASLTKPACLNRDINYRHQAVFKAIGGNVNHIAWSYLRSYGYRVEAKSKYFAAAFNDSNYHLVTEYLTTNPVFNLNDLRRILSPNWFLSEYQPTREGVKCFIKAVDYWWATATDSNQVTRHIYKEIAPGQRLINRLEQNRILLLDVYQLFLCRSSQREGYGDIFEHLAKLRVSGHQGAFNLTEDSDLYRVDGYGWFVVESKGYSPEEELYLLIAVDWRHGKLSNSTKARLFRPECTYLTKFLRNRIDQLTSFLAIEIAGLE